MQCNEENKKGQYMTPDKMESIGVRFLIVHQMIFILKFFCTIQQMNVFLYGYSIELKATSKQARWAMCEY